MHTVSVLNDKTWAWVFEISVDEMTHILCKNLLFKLY